MDEANSSSVSFHTYDEAVKWITGMVPKFGIRPGLERMGQLMERLDLPHRRLKFIHVAGTNGKGSTCAYLTEVLVRCGYDVGTFTSPYIERFTDRIRYNGKDIPQEEALRLSNRLKPLVDEIAGSELGSPTMFEICTAMAILYFATVAFPDYVVWETGLGGRLDVTNIVTPVVSVITNVGHDHMELLGESLADIAREKAGIIKAGVPVVSAVEQPDALRVLEEAAREQKSTLYLLGRQFTFETVESHVDHQRFHFVGPFQGIPGITISMSGEHQLKNAAVAVMTLEVLRQYYALIVEEDRFYEGMKHTRWAGRLELISLSPRVLLDGAHNPEGAGALAKALTNVYGYRKLCLMIGMLATKKHRDYLRHILPLADSVIVTEPNWGKKMDAEQLAKLAEEVANELNLRIEIVVESDWRSALRQLIGMTDKDDLAVVSGTLYLISDVRSWMLYQTDSEKGW